jgi:flagellar biogenesis protein FliO
LSPWEIIQAIIIMGVVIYASYYVTKLVAKAGAGGFRKTSGIKMLGNLPLAKDKSVAIVEIGDYAYILGISGQRVERLDKVPLAELNLKKEEAAPPSFTSSFKDELSKRMKKFTKQ